MRLIELNLTSIIDLNTQQFIKICETNSDYKFERSPEGKLLILSQPDSHTKQWIWAIASQLWTWNQQTGLGVTFDSLTAFELPNGAIRSPNLAWIQSARCSTGTETKCENLVELCPDFVLELLTDHDTWDNLQFKMQEYQNQGTQLGWLIDPILKKIEIYTSSQVVQKSKLPDSLSGENVLPGFLLDLKTIFP